MHIFPLFMDHIGHLKGVKAGQGQGGEEGKRLGDSPPTGAGTFRPRHRESQAVLGNEKSFESLTRLKQFSRSGARKNRHLADFFVLPEGFEPPTTVPKTGMISISPREQYVTYIKYNKNDQKSTL